MSAIAASAGRSSPEPMVETAPPRSSAAKGSRVESQPPELSLEDQELVRKWEALQLAARPLPIEDVRFLMNSHLAFWMQTFKNSTPHGPHTHDLQFIDGEYHMKMEGHPMPISEVRAKISYDAASEKLVSNGSTTEVWSYISPDGLVKKDRFSYNALFPIEVIDPKDYSKLLAEAETFWSRENPEVDLGKPKKCILQVVTTNRMHSDHWALENLAKAYPEHATYRVIMPDGKVYSFGFQMEKAEMDQVFKDKNYPFPLTFTKTTQSAITTPDYEESRPFRQKRITSLPLTEARAQGILHFIARQNEEGVRFNYIRQNCSTLGREILKIAGTSTPVRWTLGKGLSTLLPEWENIPFVGAPLAVVMETVKIIAHKFFEALWSVTPNRVQEIMCFLPRKVSTLICNALVCVLGGTLASSNLKPEDDTEDELDNRERFTCFSRLIRNLGDWFRDDLSDVEPHLTLIDWQMNQQSTRVVDYEHHVKIYF